MGGEGSGRWNDHDKRRTVEDAWALEIAAISLRGSLSYPLTGTARAIRVTGNRNVLPVRYSLVEGDKGPVLDLTYALGQTFLEPDPTERVGLLATKPARGGVRWWFACPFKVEGELCRRRVANLYLPPGGNGFGCRQCHDLTYESSQESHATDRLAAPVKAVDPSGEAYENFKRHYAQLKKQARLQRKKNARRKSEKNVTSPGLLETFEEVFGLGKES
jgi:hypothetical protein